MNKILRWIGHFFAVILVTVLMIAALAVGACAVLSFYGHLKLRTKTRRRQRARAEL